MSITRRELRELFDYNSDGTFTRRTSSNRWRAGLLVRGSIRSDGYLTVFAKGKPVLFHRAVYIWHYGKIKKEIDHINGLRHDNRIENLREVGRSENLCNLHNKPFNRTGFKNLRFRRGRWVGQVSFKRQKFEVSSKDKKVAVEKTAELRKALHGEFARP